MIRVYFVGRISFDIADEVAEYFKSIPVCRETAVIVFIDADVETVTGKKAPFVEIIGSIYYEDDDLITLANHFNQIIDVYLTFGLGPTVFHEKDHEFGIGDIVETKVQFEKKAHPPKR